MLAISCTFVAPCILFYISYSRQCFNEYMIIYSWCKSRRLLSTHLLLLASTLNTFLIHTINNLSLTHTIRWYCQKNERISLTAMISPNTQWCNRYITIIYGCVKGFDMKHQKKYIYVCNCADSILIQLSKMWGNYSLGLQWSHGTVQMKLMKHSS